MDDAAIEALVDQFRDYLRHTDGSPPVAPSERSAADQFSLFSELVGLKNEVGRESRHIKTALDDFRAMFTTIQSDNDTLKQELTRYQIREREQRDNILRPLLLQLLELFDRFEAAVTVSGAPRRRIGSWFSRTEREWIDAHLEGQQMTLRRLNHILLEYDVEALETEGRLLDPHTMRVVETVCQPGIDEGIVVGEYRKGFLWQDKLLRAAEVKVNKRKKGKDE